MSSADSALAAPPDVNHEAFASAARGRERRRRITRAASAAFVARAVTASANLLVVPLALRVLGRERFGLWTTVTSAALIATTIDFGIGSSVINAVAAADGSGDRASSRAAVSNALAMAIGIGIAVGLVGLIAARQIDWRATIGLSSPILGSEAAVAFALVAVATALTIPLGLAQRVQIGFQHTSRVVLWQAAGSVAGTLGAIVALLSGAPFRVVIAATLGLPVAVLAINNTAFFRGSGRDFRPSLSLVSRAAGGRLWRQGLLFFALQMLGAVSFQSDAFIVAHWLGAGRVAEYAVPMRLFSLIPMAMSFGLAPLWPAYREATARGDTAWVQRAFRTGLAACLGLGLPVATALVVLAPAVIGRWVGPQLPVSHPLLIALGVWALMNSVSGSIAMLLNGAERVGLQLTLAVPMAVFNVALSVYFTRRFGVVGPAAGSIVAVALFTIVPFAYLAPRLFRAAPVTHSPGDARHV